MSLAGGAGFAPGRFTGSTAIAAGIRSGMRSSARRTCTEPPTASCPSASPRSVRSASTVAVIRSLASGCAPRAVIVRSTGSPGAMTPILPLPPIVPCPALALNCAMRSVVPLPSTRAAMSLRCRPLA